MPATSGGIRPRHPMAETFEVTIRWVGADDALGVDPQTIADAVDELVGQTSDLASGDYEVEVS